jgi:hypothetical protein
LTMGAKDAKKKKLKKDITPQIDGWGLHEYNKIGQMAWLAQTQIFTHILAWFISLLGV